MFHTSVVEVLPVTEKELRMQIRKDPILSRVLELIVGMKSPFIMEFRCGVIEQSSQPN